MQDLFAGGMHQDDPAGEVAGEKAGGRSLQDPFEKMCC